MGTKLNMVLTLLYKYEHTDTHTHTHTKCTVIYYSGCTCQQFISYLREQTVATMKHSIRCAHTFNPYRYCKRKKVLLDFKKNHSFYTDHPKKAGKMIKKQ